MKDESMKKRQV
jgi:hypothetical protein